MSEGKVLTTRMCSSYFTLSSCGRPFPFQMIVGLEYQKEYVAKEEPKYKPELV